ncbi:MAG: hypothetical protein PSV36_17985 [Algoriphagus sp.]|nr:hypothetical protein [Algoriphagus sp.]
MKKFLLIAGLLFTQFAEAQISNVNLNGVPARLSGFEGVDGSPYLFEDWGKAEIGTTNAGLKQNVSYKFNIHDNELEVINEAGNPIFLNKDFVEYAILERPASLLATGVPAGMLPKLLFQKGFEMVRGIEGDDLVNVIAEGKNYTLIRKFYSDLVTPPKNSYAPTQGKMFVFEETFYLIDKNEKVTSVKSKTNSIIGALDEADQEPAKKIVKDNKLDLNREDHLVIFFQKMNEV